MASFNAFLDRKFELSKKGTNVKTEVIAGLTTFMAMVYILMVNAGMFADLGGADPVARGQFYNGVYIATAISAVIGTVLIGLLAKLPLAQASGMGLNAFFVYTVCGWGMSNGMTYANALVFILIDGIVFLLLTLTGLRKAIFNAIPEAVKVAIPAGIGLFIAFIGLQNAGIVVLDGSTKVGLVSMNLLSDNVGWFSSTRVVSITDASNMSQAIPVAATGIGPVLVTVLGVIAIAVLSRKKVKGAVLWGIVGSAVLYYIFAGIGVLFDNVACEQVFKEISMDNPFTAFKDFFKYSFGAVFKDGFDFGLYRDSGNSVADLILTIATGAFAFCIVDMFDTMGTLYGACARGNLLDEKGDVPNLNQAMFADAAATCIGAVCGTSTVTTFVESSAGIAEGGKTGLTSIVTGICFFVAMFLTPIAQLIPTYATAAALIYVGVLMMNCVLKIDWFAPEKAVPAFMTIAMTVLTYSISYGIGFGLISYVLIQIFTGNFCKTEVKSVDENGEEKVEVVKNKADIVTLVIALLFVAMFLFTH